MTVRAVRLDGFPGEINLAVQNLPPGFVASDAAIPAGQEQARLAITKQAPAGQRQNVLITGTLNTGKETATRFAPAVLLKVLPAQ